MVVAVASSTTHVYNANSSTSRTNNDPYEYL